MSEEFCLRWTNYRSNLTTVFKSCQETDDFVDVTLSADGHNLKAHKVILSASSSYFRDLLRSIPSWQHPVLLLRDIPVRDLKQILEFVYVGEVCVSPAHLSSFLHSAAILKIKGLAEQQEKGTSILPSGSEKDDCSRKRKHEGTTKDAKNQGTKQMKQKHSLQPDGSTKQEVFDTENSAADISGELTLKVEPLDDDDTAAAAVSIADQKQQSSAAVMYPSVAAAADFASLYGSGSAEAAAGLYAAAVGSEAGPSTVGGGGYASAPTGFGMQDSDAAGDGKNSFSSVSCHVCRAELSNHNAMYYHMKYVHSSQVQNIELIRSSGGIGSGSGNLDASIAAGGSGIGVASGSAMAAATASGNVTLVKQEN